MSLGPVGAVRRFVRGSSGTWAGTSGPSAAWGRSKGAVLAEPGRSHDPHPKSRSIFGNRRPVLGHARPRPVSKPAVLSATPLSSAYTDALGQRLGEQPRFLVLSRLRALPVREILRELNRLSGRALYVAFEDETSRALAPVLELFALAVRPAHLALTDEHLA